MADARHAFHTYLQRHDVEGAIGVIEAQLPGVPGRSTRKNNLSGARAVLRWALAEGRSLLYPDAAFAQAYLDHLSARYGLESSSIQNRLNHARNLYRALHAGGMVDANPFEGLTGPTHRPEVHREAYSAEEITRLCDHADAEGRALVLLGAHAGLTGPEVLRLEWANIDLVSGELRLRDRTVPLSPELLAALTELGGQPALFDGAGRLFPLPDQQALRDRLFALCRRAGVWYGARAWRALRAHAGVRWWREHHDRDRVAALLGLRGQRVPFVVQRFAEFGVKV